MLFGPRARAHQQHGPVGQAKAFGQWAAKKIHLIEAARALALPVQWHGHDGVGSHSCALLHNQIGKTTGKPRCEWLDSFVFQKNNGASKRAFIESETARQLKGKAVALAIGAIGNSLRKVRVESSGQAAKVASPRGKLLERRQTVVAQRNAAGFIEQAFA